ncbi:MAG: PAS domain-containing sensor histidine kinase [Actinobacteria bacterium]|nr:MAG: PAS domain-containing sensor histidine kinase [Actinomycetota bacterium]
MLLWAVGSETPSGTPLREGVALRLRLPSFRLHRPLATGAGLAVSLIGLFALIEWRTLVPDQGLALPTLVPLKPFTAIGLLLGGAGLLLLTPATQSRARRWAGRACGALAGAIGLVGLVEALVGPTGILHTTVTWLLGAPAATQPQPYPATALALVLNGGALITLDTRPRWRVRLTAVLITAATGIALIAMLGVVLAKLYQSAADPLAAMPLLAALALLELSIGIMAARPSYGPLEAFFGHGIGTRVARRVIPVLVLLTLGGGFVNLAALDTELVPPTTAITISTALSFVVMLVVIAQSVRLLNATDAQQRKLLRELRDEQEFTRTLLQSLNEGVVVLDAERRVVGVNRRWCELTGRSRDELLGQTPPYSWEPTGDAAERDVVMRPDGTTVSVLATTVEVPHPGGGPRAYVTTYVDITDRKRAEHALADHIRSLEKVNDELRDANQRLEQALTFKGDLIAMVSHEISQPLSSMASLAELLVADWSELTDDVRHDLAVKVDRNAQRLIALLNDLTLLFRLDAGAVTSRRASVPLADTVDSVVETLPEPRPEITATIDPDLHVLADLTHLEQVLRHLLSNAVRHGRPPIEVTATRDPDGVTVTVRDHGPGVPPEVVPKLFDRFGRGRGLGLFIVRHLVEANNGAIRYEPAEPSGARFVLRLEPAPGTALVAEPSRR